jgi:2-phosphosulfolactate phosphatase
MLNEQINILYLTEGAKKASGLVVVIDVFRAFSLEAYLYDKSVSSIQIVDSVNEALLLKKSNPELLLIGERKGIKCEGFDFGNSPSAIMNGMVSRKSIVHTTSQGTKGVCAVNSDKVITGSFVNASAIAQYILQLNPSNVSLVCMGNSSMKVAEEDVLCAEYIKSLLINDLLYNVDEYLLDLKNGSGKKFFDSEMQDIYPEQDFWMCIDKDKFDFVLIAHKEKNGIFVKKHYLSEFNKT